MKAISLSPAGKQPVKIATMMAVGTDINVGSKAKSITRHITRGRVLTAVACVAAVTAWCSALMVSTTPTPGAVITLAVSSLAGLAAITANYWQKGGEL